MKRILALVLTVFLMLSTFCIAASAQGAKEELYFYHTDSMYSVETMFEEFEEANNVDIVPIYVASEDWAQYMSTAMSGDAQIDLFEINGQDVPAYAQKGLLVNLADKVDYWDRFYPACYAPFELEGGIYAIPFADGSSMITFYNKQIFAENGLEVPVTWEDLEHCKNVLAEKDIALYVHEGAVTYMWPSWYFMLMAQATGGNAVETTFKILRGEAKFTDPESVEAMKVLEKLGTEGYFINGINAYDRDGAVQAFIDGTAAMYHSGSWNRSGFRNGGMGEDILGIMHSPLFCEAAIEGEYYCTGSASGCVLAIYHKTEKMDLCLKLCDWLTDKKMASDYRFVYPEPSSISGSVYPPYVDFEIPEGIEVDPLDEEIRAFVGHVDVWLDWYWPTLVTDAFKEGIQMVVGGQIDAETAMQNIQDVFDECVLDGYEFTLG